jgi:hypothetical protein
MIGWPLTHAIRGSLVFNLAAVCSSVMAGALLGHVRLRPLALTGSTGAVAALGLVYWLVSAPPAALTPAHEWAILGAIALVSVLAGWGIAAIYTLLSFAYPPDCRAGGMGFGLMAARTGGIVISLSGGALLALDGDSLTPFFLLLGAAAAAAGLAILVLGPRYAGRLRDLVPAS